MKKYFGFMILGLFYFGINSCKPKVPPASDLAKKIWIAQSVKENNVEVFKTGSSSNPKPGYGSYRLDLTTPPTVTLKDIDGGSYTGTYTVTSTLLSLKGLTPQPTGTGGNLDFTISTINETSLVMSNSQPYPKTGNTTNIYSLVPAN
jgi:hypothetical protein